MLGYRPGGELPWQTPDRTHAIKKASNLIHFFENLFICQFMYFALTSVPYCWILGHLIYSFPCKRDTNATNMWACFLCGSDRIASDGYKEMSTVSKFIAMNSLIHTDCSKKCAQTAQLTQLTYKTSANSASVYMPLISGPLSQRVVIAM